MTTNFAHRAWYSAGWSHEIEAGVLARRILGRDLAIFRDADGKARALDATCPHRGGDLGQGRVREGCIECPFHGWRFDGSGRCVRIPSQPAHFRIAARARVESYRLVESQDILWVWLDEAEPDRSPPHYPFFEPDSGFRRVKDSARLGAAPFVVVVENGLDNSHPPFIHPKSLPGEPEIVERQLVQFDPDDCGFRGEFDRNSPWTGTAKGHQGWADVLRPFLRLSSRDIERSYFRYELGGSAYFYDSFADGRTHVAFANVTPADETHTWFFGEQARTYWHNPIVDAGIRWWMAWLNREDVEECAKTRVADVPGGLPNPISVVADRPALAFRRVYARAVQREAEGAARSSGLHVVPEALESRAAG